MKFKTGLEEMAVGYFAFGPMDKETAKQAKVDRFTGIVMIVLNLPLLFTLIIFLLAGAIKFALYMLPRKVLRFATSK